MTTSMNPQARRWTVAAAVAAVLGGGGVVAWGAIVPTESWGTLPYAGFLEQNGVPANGTADFCFQLFPVASGGSALWAEAQPDRVVTAGAFSVRLGEVTTLNAAVEGATQLFLEVGVAAGSQGGACPGSGYTTLTGRQQLGSAAYALSAKRGIPGQGFLVDGEVAAGSVAAGSVATGSAAVTGQAQLGSLTVNGAFSVPNASITGAMLASQPIACATWTATVSNSGGSYKTATAAIADGTYARTGGGCDCGSANPGRLMVINAPSGASAWTCACKDHSVGDGNGVTTATVVGCRLH
ncbi:MAG: hypothetical protein HY904_19275 [Deltaproteobacteria bacterium]|nr:hypothetical protein [Deltaproteobacteria bacterium]